MTKDKIINEFILAWSPVFDEYPNLTQIPVYAWGRYYKYECAGSPFELYLETYGFDSFKNLRLKDMDWTLLNEIANTHNVPNGNLWTGNWGEFTPDREDMVKHWQFDDRGGNCVIIKKTNGKLSLEVVSCDSPE